jgi:hypothetical protein
MKKGRKSAKRGRNSEVGQFIIGQEQFAKISAVEGIVMTRQMRSRLAEFDRQGLSAEERRRAIIRAYRKA